MTKDSNVIVYEISKLDQEMRKAMSTDITHDNAFKRMGMIGRCLYNLMLLDIISGADAVRIIKMLGLDHIKGTSSANLRKIVRDALDKVPDTQDLAMLPYMPVFWLMPTNYHKLKMMELNEKLIREQEKNKTTQVTQRQTNGEYKRLDPIKALHELGNLSKSMTNKALKSPEFFDSTTIIGSMKILHDTSLSILKHDDSDLAGFDLNEHMEVIDQVSQFVMMMDEKPQYKGLMKEYEKFLEELEG